MSDSKKAIPASLRRWAHLIEEVEDYRSQGPDGDGYWVHLKPGWINKLHEIHSVHEDNIGQCADVFKMGVIEPCECEECTRLVAAAAEKKQEVSREQDNPKAA